MKNSPALTAYLCGPITDLPNLNLGGFLTARKEVELKGYRTIMPHDLFSGIDTSKYLHKDYMKKCFYALITTDILVLLPGWQNSKGAKQEIVLAEMLHIPIIKIYNLNELKSFSKKRNPIWTKAIQFENWFNNNFAWFFSPNKYYNN